MSVRRLLGLAALVSASLLAPGCADEDDAQPAEQPAAQPAGATSQAAVCSMNFEATVLDGGPSAGTKINGVMTLIESQPGRHAAGHLVLDDGTLLAAQASTSASVITVQVRLKDGSFVQGTGPLAAPLAQCNQTLTGVGIGPKIGAKEDGSDSDRLHWLATSVTATTVTIDTSIVSIVGDTDPYAGAPSGTDSAGTELYSKTKCISTQVKNCVQRCGANGSSSCAIKETNNCINGVVGNATVEC